MTPERSPLPHGGKADAKARARPLAAACFAWLLASTCGWLLVLAPELQQKGGTWTHGLYGLQLGLLISLFGSVPLLALHALRLLPSPAPHVTVRRTVLMAGMLLVYPAFQHAAFLTSGDAIAASAWRLPLRPLLFAAVLCGGIALWWWHLTSVAPRYLGEIPGREMAQVGLAVAGVVSLIALYQVLTYELRTYTYLARSLLLVAWLLISTLVFGLFRHIKSPELSGSLLVALVATLVLGHGRASDGVARARNSLLRDTQLTALSDMLVAWYTPGSDTHELSLDTQFDCAPVPAPADTVKTAPPTRRVRNVILISFDALRADSIGRRRTLLRKRPKPPADAGVAGGPGAATHEKAAPDRPLLMPNLTKFAAHSVDYTRAMTTYPATLMAVGGALTGLSASDILFAPTRPDNIFKQTREHFDRQLISLPSSPWFRLPIINALFVQGTHVSRRPSAVSQNRWFLQQLRRARRKNDRVFGWIHYFEPHKPYERHAGLDFGKSARDLYDSELAYVDRAFGYLIRSLGRRNYLKDSLIIVFSDHGQALGERNYRGHHVYLNSWITDIPMLVRAPGLAPGRSTALASITDVAPTVLDAAGVPYDPSALAGQSLLASPKSDGSGSRVAFAEAFPVRGRQLFELTNTPIRSIEQLAKRVDLIQRSARNYLPKVSAVSSRYRLIVNRVTGAKELYDRKRDPQEKNDLSQTDPMAVRGLSEALKRWTREQSERVYCSVAREKSPVRPRAAPASMQEAGVPARP